MVYGYDNNGNQVSTFKDCYENGFRVSSIQIRSNTYNKRNQLTGTITNDGNTTGTVQNAYNGEGYRVSKTVNGVTTKYFYEYDKVILELDNSNNQLAWNIYGENLLARKVTIVIDTSYETLYYMYNGHGDVTDLLDEDGVVVATYEYDWFGNIISSTGNPNNNITYGGYQYDKETGLYYLNARMYDPLTARFLQEDTYEGDKNDPLSLNRYTYCDNEPLMYSDPTGHWRIIGSGAIKEDDSDTVESLIMMTTGNLGDIEGAFHNRYEVESLGLNGSIDISYLLKLIEVRENANAKSTADQKVYRTEDNSGKKYGSIDKGEEVWVHQENGNMTQVTYEITKKTYGNVIKTGWVSSDKLEDHISIREEEMVLGVIADIALYNDRLDEKFLSVLGPNYKQHLTQSQKDALIEMGRSGKEITAKDLDRLGVTGDRKLLPSLLTKNSNLVYKYETTLLEQWQIYQMQEMQENFEELQNYIATGIGTRSRRLIANGSSMNEADLGKNYKPKFSVQNIVDKVSEKYSSVKQAVGKYMGGLFEGAVNSFKIGETGFVNPKNIRFTQGKISETFGKATEHAGESIDDLISGLKSGNVKPGDLPAIRIYEKDGKFYSLDNRRLYCAQEAGVNVKYEVINPNSPSIAKEITQKFDTTNDGTSIIVRRK